MAAILHVITFDVYCKTWQFESIDGLGFFEVIVTLWNVPVAVRVLRFVVDVLLPREIFTGGFCSGTRDVPWFLAKLQ
jgi:hypothetical protein